MRVTNAIAYLAFGLGTVGAFKGDVLFYSIPYALVVLSFWGQHQLWNWLGYCLICGASSFLYYSGFNGFAVAALIAGLILSGAYRFFESGSDWSFGWDGDSGGDGGGE